MHNWFISTFSSLQNAESTWRNLPPLLTFCKVFVFCVLGSKLLRKIMGNYSRSWHPNHLDVFLILLVGSLNFSQNKSRKYCLLFLIHCSQNPVETGLRTITYKQLSSHTHQFKLDQKLAAFVPWRFLLMPDNQGYRGHTDLHIVTPDPIPTTDSHSGTDNNEHHYCQPRSTLGPWNKAPEK